MSLCVCCDLNFCTFLYPLTIHLICQECIIFLCFWPKFCINADLTFASFAFLDHWLFVSSRGLASGRGNCQARRVGAEPLRGRRCLHHGWDWKGLQEGKGDEERWGKPVVQVNLGGGGIHQEERRCRHVGGVLESTQPWLASIAAGTIKQVLRWQSVTV